MRFWRSHQKLVRRGADSVMVTLGQIISTNKALETAIIQVFSRMDRTRIRWDLSRAMATPWLLGRRTSCHIMAIVNLRGTRGTSQLITFNNGSRSKILGRILTRIIQRKLTAITCLQGTTTSPLRWCKTVPECIHPLTRDWASLLQTITCWMRVRRKN